MVGFTSNSVFDRKRMAVRDKHFTNLGEISWAPNKQQDIYCNPNAIYPNIHADDDSIPLFKVSSSHIRKNQLDKLTKYETVSIRAAGTNLVLNDVAETKKKSIDKLRKYDTVSIGAGTKIVLDDAAETKKKIARFQDQICEIDNCIHCEENSVSNIDKRSKRKTPNIRWYSKEDYDNFELDSKRIIRKYRQKLLEKQSNIHKEISFEDKIYVPGKMTALESGTTQTSLRNSEYLDDTGSLNDSFAWTTRGLETTISVRAKVSFLHRKNDYQNAVMEEQAKQRLSKTGTSISYDESKLDTDYTIYNPEELRTKAEITSKRSKRIAWKLAQEDAYDANTIHGMERQTKITSLIPNESVLLLEGNNGSSHTTECQRKQSNESPSVRVGDSLEYSQFNDVFENECLERSCSSMDIGSMPPEDNLGDSSSSLFSFFRNDKESKKKKSNRLHASVQLWKKSSERLTKRTSSLLSVTSNHTISTSTSTNNTTSTSMSTNNDDLNAKKDKENLNSMHKDHDPALSLGVGRMLDRIKQFSNRRDSMSYESRHKTTKVGVIDPMDTLNSKNESLDTTSHPKLADKVTASSKKVSANEATSNSKKVSANEATSSSKRVSADDNVSVNSRKSSSYNNPLEIEKTMKTYIMSKRKEATSSRNLRGNSSLSKLAVYEPPPILSSNITESLSSKEGLQSTTHSKDIRCLRKMTKHAKTRLDDDHTTESGSSTKKSIENDTEDDSSSDFNSIVRDAVDYVFTGQGKTSPSYTISRVQPIYTPKVEEPIKETVKENKKSLSIRKRCKIAYNPPGILIDSQEVNKNSLPSSSSISSKDRRQPKGSTSKCIDKDYLSDDQQSNRSSRSKKKTKAPNKLSCTKTNSIFRSSSSHRSDIGKVLPAITPSSSSSVDTNHKRNKSKEGILKRKSSYQPTFTSDTCEDMKSTTRSIYSQVSSKSLVKMRNINGSFEYDSNDLSHEVHERLQI